MILRFVDCLFQQIAVAFVFNLSVMSCGNERNAEFLRFAKKLPKFYEAITKDARVRRSTFQIGLHEWGNDVGELIDNFTCLSCDKI